MRAIVNWTPALIGLGASLPYRALEPAAIINAAVVEIAGSQVSIEEMSRLYASPAWPDPSDPAFVNAVVKLRTGLSPEQLLARLHETEAIFGRTRLAPNAPRTLDLDIIDYDGRVEYGPPVLPHPRMHSRAFVLVPLAEVAPGWRHPKLGLTVELLLANLSPSERQSIVPISSICVRG